MPEKRLQRTREAYVDRPGDPLPECPDCGMAMWIGAGLVNARCVSPYCNEWRAPHQNAAEQLARRADFHAGED